MKYVKRNWKYIGCLVFVFLSFNFYYVFLIPQADLSYLAYLDVLIGVGLLTFWLIDSMTFYRKEKEKAFYLESDDYVSDKLEDLEEAEIFEHDFRIFQQKLDEQISVNQDLQDFITKWCHEVKIPLSAAMLINERIEDSNLKLQLREQLERIKQSLNAALVSCKAQANLYDIQVSKVKLEDCVNTSVRNNRYFLINNKVDMCIELHDEYIYSDKEWLVYIVDQLLSNAMKYAKENPKIHIWSQEEGDCVRLFIKDFGEGIKDYDLPRIFERGYVGNNHHNGKYRSTGMGLYMVMLMIKKLGHSISVESVYQEYTCFCITFKNIEKYFHL